MGFWDYYKKLIYLVIVISEYIYESKCVVIRIYSLYYTIEKLEVEEFKIKIKVKSITILEILTSAASLTKGSLLYYLAPPN